RDGQTLRSRTGPERTRRGEAERAVPPRRARGMPRWGIRAAAPAGCRRTRTCPHAASRDRQGCEGNRGVLESLEQDTEPNQPQAAGYVLWKIGRASCRERGEILESGVTVEKKNRTES